MKIILSNTQYKRLFTESMEDKLSMNFDKVINVLKKYNNRNFINELLTFYDGFDDFLKNSLINYNKFIDLFIEKVLNVDKPQNFSFSRFNDDYSSIGDIQNEIITYLNEKGDYKTLINFLIKGKFLKFNDTTLELIIDSLPNILEYYDSLYEPKKVIKNLSVLVSNINYKWYLGNRFFYPILKDYAQKNGLTLIDKNKGYTFNKGDEGTLIRSLINYIKEVPVLPKKNRKGFLDYLGLKDKTRGHYSSFWSAALQSGIIQKVGSGKNTTYQLGPNYENWEKGNIVAF